MFTHRSVYLQEMDNGQFPDQNFQTRNIDLCSMVILMTFIKHINSCAVGMKGLTGYSKKQFYQSEILHIMTNSML